MWTTPNIEMINIFFPLIVMYFFFLINTVSFIQEQNKAEFNTSLRTRVKDKLRRAKLIIKKKRILDKYWGKKWLGGSY